MIRRLKTRIRPVLGEFDSEGRLLREILCPEAILYGDQAAQLVDLLEVLEEEANAQEDDQGHRAQLRDRYGL